MAEEKDHCLICHDDLNSSKDLGFKCDDDGAAPDKRSGISNQLNVIFILRKLLHIPALTLEEYLKVSGGENPDRWICLCEECDGLVASARKQFEEFISAARKFKAAQERVVRKLKESLTEKSGAPLIKPEDGIIKIGTLVTENSRKFVGKHEYKESFQDPSIGDIFTNKALQSVTIHNPLSPRAPPVQSSSSPYFDMEDELGSISSISSSDDVDLEDTKKKKKSVTPKSHSKAENLVDEEGAFVEGRRIKFKCQLESCGKIFSRRFHYLEHKLTHSSSKERQKISCELCDKQFFSRGGRSTHVKREHEKMPPPPTKKVRYQRTCPHCGVVTDKYRLPEHIQRVHEKVRPLSCELCGRGVSSKRDLTNHQVDVHKICSVEGCKQTFESREQLHHHQMDNHGKEIDIFSCTECGKLFVTRSTLKRHLQNHEFKTKLEEEGDAAKEFICDLCGKGFGIRSQLHTHRWAVHLRRRKRFKKSVQKS